MMKRFLTKLATKIRHHLYSLYYTCFSYGRSFLILFVCLWAGNFLSMLMPIVIPGSIIGLLILFFLLTFQLIPTHWVQCGCTLFTRYMTILFIPAAMGIMDNYIYLIHSWAPIIIGSISSTLIVMVFIGWLTQHLHNRFQPSINDKTEQEKP